MKKLAALPLCLGCVFAVSTSHAIDLKQSKVTQVVNDVQIINATSQQPKTATVNDIFSMPDILRTGPASRAELVAADETVTRVGANTIFSFDPANRTIDLQQGSLLFHSPHGMGGGTIHTGSATASVLGTTLIITTTPSGGMKVLDLEGSVEVNFLNGLKQNLAPGQMTFVLPGGKQLAPIIVYRLDDLTKNSLLVNGFNQNLASMPLIQQQIDKQLSLIESGKLTDTGLGVGDDANSGGIQTLDLGTLQAALDQSFVNSASVVAAFAFNATINQPSLPNSHPERIFLTSPSSPFVLTGNTFYTGQPFEGFAAKNIYFNTIGLNPLTVDLSLYANAPEFDFVAKGNLMLEGSVTFDGLSASANADFSLVAGTQLTVAPGAIITANVADFNWQSPDDFILNGAIVHNFAGNTSFLLGGNFTMENGAYIQTEGDVAVLTAGNISINGSTLVGDSTSLTSANGTIDFESSTISMNSSGILTAKGDITVNNSAIYANPDSGLAGFTSQSGSVNITATSIQAGSLNVSSGDGILLDGTGQSFNVGNASFTAPNLITLNNVNFNNIGYVNAVANTTTVMGSNFNVNGAYNFGVPTGTANVNDGVVSGEANFINDSIGGTALTSVSQVDEQESGPKNTAGIHVYTR